MAEKSYVSLEKKICIVTGESYETDAILLDTRMRDIMERYTVTGFGLGPEAKKQIDKGFIALVGIDPDKSEEPFKPDTVWRTGKIAYLRREVAKKVLNVDVYRQPMAYVEDGVIDYLLKESPDY